MSENSEKKQEKQSSEKEETPVQKEPVKSQEKPKEKKQESKKEKESDDFQYIVRLSNTDVDGEKSLINGLTSIKGIGRHLSSLVIDNSGLNRSMKVGNLSEKQIEILQNAINDIEKKAPYWLLNHRKEYESGEDKHLIGPQIELNLRDEVNIMRKIRCYRGIRHETGLPCRGQRTRANNRKGLSLGVSKKRN